MGKDNLEAFNNVPPAENLQPTVKWTDVVLQSVGLVVDNHTNSMKELWSRAQATHPQTAAYAMGKGYSEADERAYG
ncbi:MAG: hypothetical protein HYX67_17525 [Candidatus Melainabacteria bacterium]|nr:hypothetical protein [Candidatus Melainabacteria bacterium]